MIWSSYWGLRATFFRRGLTFRRESRRGESPGGDPTARPLPNMAPPQKRGGAKRLVAARVTRVVIVNRNAAPIIWYGVGRDWRDVFIEYRQ